MANNCRQAIGVHSITILTCMVCFMYFGFQLIFHKQSTRSPAHFCSHLAAANSLLSHLVETNSHFVGASPFLPSHMETPPTQHNVPRSICGLLHNMVPFGYSSNHLAMHVYYIKRIPDYGQMNISGPGHVYRSPKGTCPFM